MNPLQIRLWNDDVLSVPYVNGRYNCKTVVNHMKLLLKSMEQEKP